MTFLHPEFLYMMLPAVIVLFYFLLAQKEHMNSYFSDEVLGRLRVHTNMMTLRARNALFLVVFILMIIALAQPVIEEGKVKVQAKSADVMIALDISDSMLAEDLYPSRLELAKQKILELLSRSQQERFGVMAFAKDAYLVAPLSFDHRAVHFLVKQLKPSFITEKGTDYERLITSAGEMMKENDQKYLLLLTDGGDQESFGDEIDLVKKLGIKVFVLALGTEKGAPIKLKEGGYLKHEGAILISRLNKNIADLATQSGGSYIEAVISNEDVDAMIGEIKAKTTRHSLKEEEITQYIQLFYYPLGLAMLLLLFATSSMFRRKTAPAAFIAAWAALQGVPAEAALLDFLLLDDAKTAYESGDFNRSAKLYGDYAQRHKSGESQYDKANALYKAGDYAAAAKGFEEVRTGNEALQFDLLHNLGNAYAKQGKPEMLEKAVETYEKALLLKDEKPTRENLERVKEALEKLKKEQEQQQSDEGKEGKKGDQDQKQDQKGDKKQDEQQKEGEQKEGEQKEGDNANEDDKKSQSQKSGKKPEDKKKEKASDSKEKEMTEEEKQKKSAKSDAAKDEQSPEQKAAAMQEAQLSEMSDREAEKWLKMLSKQPASHIYRLGPQSQPQESSNEKPW